MKLLSISRGLSCGICQSLIPKAGWGSDLGADSDVGHGTAAPPPLCPLLSTLHKKKKKKKMCAALITPFVTNHIGRLRDLVSRLFH